MQPFHEICIKYKKKLFYTNTVYVEFLKAFFINTWGYTGHPYILQSLRNDSLLNNNRVIVLLLVWVKRWKRSVYTGQAKVMAFTKFTLFDVVVEYRLIIDLLTFYVTCNIYT